MPTAWCSVRLVLAVMLALAIPAASAQVYKWVDEKGRVHYGEKPPAGAKSSTVRPPTAPSGPAKAQDLQSQELDFRRRQIKKGEDDAKEARDNANRQARCDSAKENLSIAEQAALFRRQKGERVFLSDAERNAEIEKMRADMTRYCR